VGNALGANPIPIVIPCHRVLRAGLLLGGYGGGTDRKAWLLKRERVLA
jgi:O-6-methylguanine DNA methyltransferase